jgi:predicted 3-demethylubiquinone-9 3-methyltransferase (glyoxalase superfamily)
MVAPGGPAIVSAFASYRRVTPFLWFNDNAEQAVDLYLAVFRNSRRLESLNDPGAGSAKVITIAFELDGQKFTALNGGPHFNFNESVSLLVRCDTQEEIDEYWAKLSAGGSEGQCGWLKDKFGLSWQIVPSILPDLIRYPKAMQAMMPMKKLDLAVLQSAALS